MTERVIVKESGSPIVRSTSVINQVRASQGGAGGGSSSSASVIFTQGDVVLGRSSSTAGQGQEIPCTSFGRSMIAAANAAAALVVLGTAAIYSPIAHSHAFSTITGTPTTIAGYGITDPIVLTSGSYANPAWVTSLAWSKISGVPSFAYYGLQGLTAGSVVFAGASDTLAQDNANFFWDATNHRLGVGTAGPTSALQVVGSAVATSVFGTTAGVFGTTVAAPNGVELYAVCTSSSDPRGIMSAQYSTDALGARMHFRKGRGTEASPAIVVTADVLGRLRFSGYDGSSYLQMASIDVVSTGTVASTRVPTYMAFSTATDAAPSVLTERMRIYPDGSIAFASGTATPQTPLGSFSFTKEGTKTGQVTYDAYSTTGGSFSFQFRLARGTIAAPTAVQSGDNLGSFGWAGFDGTIFPATAFLQANTEETFNGSSARGTRIGFNVQAPAGGVRAERLRLTGAGRLIGGTSIVDDGISWHQVVGGTATVSQPLFTGTQTWNAGGITFSADVINITDTASAAASLLIDRQVGGVSKFSVTKAGTATTVQLQVAVASGNGITIASVAASSSPTISAVGADTDIDIIFTPKGAGLMRFGAHTALAAEALSGYVTIKDGGGTSRKLAVIS